MRKILLSFLIGISCVAALASTTSDTSPPVVDSSSLPSLSAVTYDTHVVKHQVNPNFLGDLKFTRVTNPVVEPIFMVSRFGSQYGVSLPIFDVSFNGRRQASVVLLGTADGSRMEYDYMGIGLSIPLATFNSCSINVVGGYSANFDSINHPRQGAWVVGISACIRF